MNDIEQHLNLINTVLDTYSCDSLGNRIGQGGTSQNDDEYEEHWADICLAIEEIRIACGLGETVNSAKNYQIKCPECGSDNIYANGTLTYNSFTNDFSIHEEGSDSEHTCNECGLELDDYQLEDMLQKAEEEAEEKCK